MASVLETVTIAPPRTEPTRRLPVDDGATAYTGLNDDVDATERSCRLIEQTLDVELVGDVGANGERRAVRGEDLLNRGFGVVLVAHVDHDDGVAPPRQPLRDLAADPGRAPGDDRDRVVGPRVVGTRGHTGTLAAIAHRRARAHPGLITGHCGGLGFTDRWPPTARRRSGAGPASVRRSTGCWRTSAAARARSWSSAASRASARRRSCTTALGRRPASGSRGSRASSPRWSCRSRGCISSARRCSAARRASRAAAGRPARRAGPRVRRCPRPLPGRAGRAQPACRGRRGAAAALLRRRRAVARRRLGPGPRLRRAAAAGGVGGDRVRGARRGRRDASWWACRSCALEGLEDEDARALLATVIPGRLDERVRDRIVAETRGNPLALLELPRGLSAAQLAGGFGLPEPLPLSGRIEESFLRRLEELPDDTRLLLLVAAAEPVGDPALMWRAAMRLGVPARRSSLPHGPGCWTSVRRCASAIRWCARRSIDRLRTLERQTAHGALAEVTDACARPGSPRLAPRAGAREGRTRTSRPSSSGRRVARRPAAGSPPRRRSWGGRPT